MAYDWATPRWLMSVFRYFFDPCPLNGVSRQGTKKDGLLIPWADMTYVNCPYSDPLPWCKKAVQEWRQGKTIVMLLKHDPTTEWARVLIDAGAHFLYLGERLRYSESAKAAFCSDLVILSKEDLIYAD